MSGKRRAFRRVVQLLSNEIAERGLGRLSIAEIVEDTAYASRTYNELTVATAELKCSLLLLRSRLVQSCLAGQFRVSNMSGWSSG